MTGRRLLLAAVLALLLLTVWLGSGGPDGPPPERDPDSEPTGSEPVSPARPEATQPDGTPHAASGAMDIHGRVVRADDGSAVAGARVLSFDHSTGGRDTVETDEEGRFSLPAGPGALHLVVRKPGLAPARVERVRPAAGTLLIRLEVAGAIEGKVLGKPEAHPLPGTRVAAVHRLFTTSDEFDYDRAIAWQALPRDLAVAGDTVTDGAGRFRIEGLRPGKYVLLVSAPNRQPTFSNDGGRYYQYQGFEVRADETTSGVVVLLPPIGRITFRVTDGATGAPLEGVEIRAEIEVDDREFLLPCPTRSPVAGRYELAVGLSDQGRIDGGYFLLTKDGYSPHHTSFSGQDDGSVFEVELSRPARIIGTVRGRDGRPVAGAVVFLRRDSDRGLVTRVATDGGGAFEAGPLPARTKLELLVYGPEMDAPISILPLLLEPGEEREVRIGAGDRPAIVGTVRLLGRPVPRAFLSLDSPDERRIQIRTDAEGRFRFDGLSPGAHEIYVRFDTGDGNEAEIERLVEVVSGAPTTVDFDVDLLIRGTAVVEREGGTVPADDVSIAARRVDVEEPGERFSGDTDADGAFAIRLTESGIYELFCPYVEHTVLSAPRIDLTGAASVEDVRVVLVEDPGDGVVLIHVRDAATGDPVTKGSWRWSLKSARGVGSFGNGRIEEEDAGIGRHRYTVRTRLHAPVTVEVAITRTVRRVERTVDLPLSDSVLVTSVEAGRRAADAGLRAGDAIRTHGKTPVRNVAELIEAVGTTKPADRIELTVLRGGGTITLTIAGGRMGIGVANHRAGSGR